MSPRSRSDSTRSLGARGVAETSFGVATAMGIGLLLGACGGLPDDVLERVTTSQQAVAGGYLDPLDRAVVGLQSPGHPICSGALIARNVVLTARHCVSDVYGTPMSNHDFCEVSTCGPPRPAEDFYVTAAESFPLDPSEYHRVREVIGLESSYLCGSDLAMLILKEPVDESEASPLTPRIDTPLEGGNEYSAIGFGGTDGAGTGAGIRRRRDGLIATCVGTACPPPEPPAYIEIKETEWMGFEGTCPGDSGGPAIDREGRVAGVLSRGEAACKTSIYSHVAGWGSWIKQTTAHAASLGGIKAPAWTIEEPPDPIDTLPLGEEETTACSVGRMGALDFEQPTAQRSATALSALALIASWRRNKKLRSQIQRSPHRTGRRAIIAALAALLIPGCKQRGPSGKGARVVSLSPSTTEAAFAIGAGALLVGRSKFCDHPPEAQTLPVVGGYADPSLEAIIALDPTVVIGARGPAGPALEQALKARGLTTFFPETESIAQIEAMLSDLGRLLQAEAGAAKAVGELRAKKDAVTAAVAPLPRVKVALLFDATPIVAAGPGSFPDELIRLAGGENVITEGGAYPTINIEHLLALNPHVLLDGMTDTGMPGGSGPGIPRESPGFKELSAVREGRVRALATSTALRPGPRIGEGLVSIARAIHGDALMRPL